MTWTHVFSERGNGFPSVGDDVISEVDGDICLLTIADISSIHTTQWQANRVYLVCEPCTTEWEDLSAAHQDRLYDRLCHVSPIDDDDD